MGTRSRNRRAERKDKNERRWNPPTLPKAKRKPDPRQGQAFRFAAYVRIRTVAESGGLAGPESPPRVNPDWLEQLGTGMTNSRRICAYCRALPRPPVGLLSLYMSIRHHAPAPRLCRRLR